MKRFGFLFSLVFSVFLAACAQAQEPMLLPLDPAKLVFEVQGGEVAFDLEVADDDRERAAGLMFRADFPVDRAMIFVYPEEDFVAFWMKNTPRSLDMIFVDASGAVVQVHEGAVPLSLDPIPSERPVRFVVEVNAGIAQKHGIVPGTRAIHPVINGG